MNKTMYYPITVSHSESYSAKATHATGIMKLCTDPFATLLYVQHHCVPFCLEMLYFCSMAELVGIGPHVLCR